MGFPFDEYTNSGNYFKFENVGDKIRGEILSIVEGKDFGGNPCPVLEIDTDEGEMNVTASQVMLKAELAEVRPEVGDEVTIEHSGLGDPKPGRNPAKLFTITIHE